MEVLGGLDCEIVAAVNKSHSGASKPCGKAASPRPMLRSTKCSTANVQTASFVAPRSIRYFRSPRHWLRGACRLCWRNRPAPRWPSSTSCAGLSTSTAHPQMVGLNRRHYSVIGRAGRSGRPRRRAGGVHRLVRGPGASAAQGIYRPADFAAWVFSNSIHGLDLLTYLGGPDRRSPNYGHGGRRKFNWYMALAGRSEQGVLGSFRSSWGSPGRWRLNVCTPDRRYVFAPLETCEVQERGAGEPRQILPDEFDAQLQARLLSTSAIVSENDRRRRACPGLRTGKRTTGDVSCRTTYGSLPGQRSLNATSMLKSHENDAAARSTPVSIADFVPTTHAVPCDFCAATEFVFFCDRMRGGIDLRTVLCGSGSPRRRILSRRLIR